MDGRGIKLSSSHLMDNYLTDYRTRLSDELPRASEITVLTVYCCLPWVAPVVACACVSAPARARRLYLRARVIYSDRA